MKINTEFGVLYKEGVDETPYLIDEVKNYQLLTNQTSLQTEKKLKVLLLHTVGKFCQGSCSFCISVEERREEKIDIDKLSTLLDEQRHLFDDEISLSLTGGEPLNYYKPVIDMVKTKFKKLNLTFFTSLFISENAFDKFLVHVDEYQKEDVISSIRICVSIDYGSGLRKSDIFNMTGDDVFERSKVIIERFKDVDNIHVQLYNVFTKGYDVNKIKELYKWFNKNKADISSITYNMLREDETNNPSFDDIRELQKITNKYIVPEDIILTRFSYIAIIGDKYKRDVFKYLDGQKLKLVQLDDAGEVFKVFTGNFCPMYARIQMAIDPKLEPGGCFHLYDVYKDYDSTIFDKCDGCDAKGSCGYCGYFRVFCVKNDRLYSSYIKAYMTELENKINSGKYNISEYII